MWPEKTITRSVINVSSSEKNSIDFKVKDDNLFRLKDNGKLVGYMYLAQAPSRADKFDFMVIFKPDLSVMTIQVLVYREDYGGEIGSKRWLKQFYNKKNGEGMKFRDDIQNISGATISAQSITKRMQQLSKNMVVLKEKGIL